MKYTEPINTTNRLQF